MILWGKSCQEAGAEKGEFEGDHIPKALLGPPGYD
jgi:hypothetical protein